MGFYQLRRELKLKAGIREVWYFKIVNCDANKIFAIIPGVSISHEGKSHSFIQVLDGISTQAGQLIQLLKWMVI